MVGQLSHSAVEADALLSKQRRLWILGGREMRVNRGELEIRAREQLRQRALQVVEPKSEAVHARVDFQVIAHAQMVLRRGGLHGTGGPRGRDRRRQLTVEEAVQIANAQRAEHQDLRADARLAQRLPFFDVGACQDIGARIFERARDLRGAVTVPIRLDDGDDAWRAAAAGGKIPGDAAVVGPDGVESDARDGRTDHQDCRMAETRIARKSSCNVTIQPRDSRTA